MIFINDLFDSQIEQRAILVSVLEKGGDNTEAEISLGELERLLETAGGRTFGVLTQNKENPDIRTYIGSGKVEELKEMCENNEIRLVIFDAELTPSQIKNLENELGDVTVIDRTMLILDIFALHAQTGEGKLQVELAQLKYTMPRLYGKGAELSRLGGGIGTRGPGETKLETDRRHVKRRIAALEEEIEALSKNRSVQRSQRDKSGIYKIAIAGYTNAGKSTLLNYLTDANILAENKLFATLDPTTRKFTLPSGIDILLTDTVGFIRNLPHHLIKAFKSTLDEVSFADAILVIIDASDPEAASQLDVTERLLNDLGAGDKEIIYVYNKSDLLEKPPYLKNEKCVAVSAKTGMGIDKLVEKLEELAQSSKCRTEFFIPNAEQGSLNTLYKNAVVENVEYGNEGVSVVALCDAKTRGMLKKYIIS